MPNGMGNYSVVWSSAYGKNSSSPTRRTPYLSLVRTRSRAHKSLRQCCAHSSAISRRAPATCVTWRTRMPSCTTDSSRCYWTPSPAMAKSTSTCCATSFVIWRLSSHMPAAVANSAPAYPAEREADIALRDGSIAHVRPIRTDDEASLLELLQALSSDDRLLRFFSLGTNLARTAQEEASVDYVRSYGLVVTVGADRRIVGHALYAPIGEGRAEVAF